MENEAKEKGLKPWVGGIISACVDGEKIASWNDEFRKRFYCKVFYKDGKWTAITNPIYKGHGLIVFIDRHPVIGEQIRIIRVSRSYAVGVVVTGE